MLDVLTLDVVRAAAARIQPYVLRTPVFEVQVGSTTLLLKAESLQPIGAFKLRGAFNVMLQLPADCPGVVTHSSGNHAQAMARAAKVLGKKAVIVMPSDAPEQKRARTAADGAEIVTVSPDADERVRKAEQLAQERGLVLVQSYDQPEIAAGQGTAALELLEQAGPLDAFYCPVSGGGLLSGCATVLGALSPATEIVGVEPEAGDDTRQSFAKGERVKIPPPETLADGLKVRIPGVLTFPVLRRHVRRIEVVSDQALLSAMAWALSALRIVLEPSGAAGLAVALRENRPGRVGVLLSGGNVDWPVLQRAVDMGLGGFC